MFNVFLGYVFYQIGLLPVEVSYVDEENIQGLRQHVQCYEEPSEAANF